MRHVGHAARIGCRGRFLFGSAVIGINAVAGCADRQGGFADKHVSRSMDDLITEPRLSVKTLAATAGRRCDAELDSR